MAKDAKFDNWVSYFEVQDQLAAQRRPAGARALEDDLADQHPDLDARAQPVLLRRGHRGEPASVPGQGPDDAGREPGGRSTCAPSPASTTSRSATSTSASCRSSWRTSRRAATPSTSIRPPTARTRPGRPTRASSPIPRSRSGCGTKTSATRWRSASTAISSTRSFWLGVGTPGSVAPDESSPYNPGPEWRKKWATLDDPKQANELLDKIGLTKKDAEGYRLRTDNGQRLRIEVVGVEGSFVPFPKIGEMIAQQLKQIGIQIDMVVTSAACTSGAATATRSRRSSGRTTAPSCCTPSRTTRSRSGSARRWGRRSASGYQSGGTAGHEAGRSADRSRRSRCSRAAPGWKRPSGSRPAQEIWKIVAEETWSIGTVGLSPAVMGVRIVKNNLGNIPARQFNGQHGRTPCAALPPTWFFKS